MKRALAFKIGNFKVSTVKPDGIKEDVELNDIGIETSVELQKEEFDTSADFAKAVLQFYKDAGTALMGELLNAKKYAEAFVDAQRVIDAYEDEKDAKFNEKYNNHMEEAGE